MTLEDEIKRMVTIAVNEAMDKAGDSLINRVRNVTNEASVTFEADQKSVKPRIHVYGSTTREDLTKMIELGMEALIEARDAIAGKDFEPSPLIGNRNGRNIT